jgi:hypothetical protein
MLGSVSMLMEKQERKRKVRIKSVTYLAIILAGFFTSLVFPIAEMTGIGFTTLFCALFLPYFGWKNILKIKAVIFIAVLIIGLPSFLAMTQNSLGIIEQTNRYIHSLPNPYNEPLPELPDFVSPTQPLGFLFNSGILLFLFLAQIFWIWTTNKMLRKHTFYKLFLS